MKEAPLGPAPKLPAPLTLPELDAIRSNDGQVEVYRSLRSLMEQHNAVVGYLDKTSGRGVLQQSAGPLLASARATACSITLYWQTRGDGFAPQFYQVWQADAGTTAAPTTPTFDAAIRTTRIPSELNTPLIVRSRFVWTDKDFTSAEITAGERRAYWITAIDVDGNESLPVAIAPLAPAPCGGSGGSDEIAVTVDTSGSDETYTLQDPATLPSPATVVNVKNWSSGGYMLTIAPGVGLTIDGKTTGINTRTPNQGYRFRWGPSFDAGPVDGWVCIETVFGGDSGGSAAGGPPEGTPGIVACASTPPNWIIDPVLAADYQILTDENGTYTKPDGDYTFIGVVGWGSGGAGGSGNFGNGSGENQGGAGGGGGARKIQIYDFDTFPATASYHVARGGIGPPQSEVDDGVTVITLPADGGNGESSIMTNSVPGDIFSVGGGIGGIKGEPGGPGDRVGGEGGSWDQDGTTEPDNVNGTGGVGAGGVRSYDSPSGCAECGGAGGACGGSDPGGPFIGGGGSLHGGAGGGGGGSWIFSTVMVDGNAGGAGSSSSNEGGGAAGLAAYPTGDNGGAGSPGAGLDGGGGGGGGGSGGWGAGNLTGGNGGAGGIPGGGGGGGGTAANNGGVPVKKGGAGGYGARGELRVYVV